MQDQKPFDEPMAIIEEEACAMARCFGVAVPEVAAASLVDRILLRLGGAHVYLPRRTAQKRQRMHQEMANRFNGTNLFELAKEYDISARHLRRILARSRVERP
ncbi:Mor family transcriptional regulator [Variovorax paradoxus]|uniref:Mor transcription activator family protein n=1 Tax=Variovorax paradoxus TaxID=34073 RepID=UPI0027860E91|nr:Mor transcription activator family protein [Variovorax paradoxus]MDP9965096.1 Mor family transcriptional regulator [Variovorax paradoxus]